MADNPSQISRIRNSGMDPSYDAYDEDPLVELARIVSEEGGYLNISEQNRGQAVPDPGLDIGYDELEPDVGIDLENQLMEELELSMASPDGNYEEELREADYVPAEAAYADEHFYAPEDSAALAQISAGTEDVVADYGVEPGAADGDWQASAQDDMAEPASVGPVPDEYAIPESADVLSAKDISDLENALSGPDDYQEAVLSEGPAELMGFDAVGPADDDLIDDDLIDEDREPIDEYQIPPVIPVGGEFGDRPASEERSGRKMFAIAAVLSIAVLGGGVLAMMSSTSNNQIAEAPPVFKADGNPVKVVPDDGQDVASGGNQTVFDIAANENEPAREELVERAEKPVDRIIPLEETQQTDVLRAVGGSVEKDADRLGADNSIAETAKIEPIGPRQVTTVKVSADGTIIRPSLDENSSPSEAGSETTIIGGLPTPVAETGTAFASVSEPKPVPVQVVEINTSKEADQASGTAEETPSPLTDIVASLPKPADSTTQVDAETVGVAIPLPRARPEETPKVTVANAATGGNALVAQPAVQTQGTAPVNLLNGTNTRTAERQQAAPASTGSTGAASGYLVQLSSQRSEDQALAAFDGLKRRYPSLLGNYEANIQRADLGSRGIYYRVRVGPMADQAGAAQFCQQLKSSGGSCFVTR